MKYIQFTINYRITGKDSLNTIYSSAHWKKRNDYANKIHFIARNALQRAKIPTKTFDKAVFITFQFPPDNLDIDNHSYFAKCVVDALKNRVICDDNKKWVEGITLQFTKRDNILVRIGESA